MNLDFSAIKVLLIGDLMLDHYIIGKSSRISPEAPVPVVIPEEEYFIPGGAGNVAMNLSSMGADVTCLGVIGDDVFGKKLLSILENEGININQIKTISNHPTTLKQRIYSNGKQVARLDRERLIDIKSDFLSNNINNYNVCILSDYNKGVIKDIKINTDMVIVDPKKDDFSLYKNAHIITPNLNELQRATQIDIEDNQSIIDACSELIKENNFTYVVAKKGAEGMIITGKNNFVKHIKPHYVESPDVTGAGDTVISALSIAYAQSKDIELSAKIANAAAAIVVEKPGTATATIKEVEKLLMK